jgi:OOP family OmpA-OmpF porin
MRPNPILMTLSAFVAAAALSVLMALFVGNALESRSERHVKRALLAEGLDWAQVSADGLIVTLRGTAPTEAMRFRATTVAGRIAGSGRVIEELDVTPAQALTAPRFSLELLRNDDGVSMIGLVPTEWDTAALTETARIAAQSGSLANMLETADFAIPAGWVQAVDFGLAALRLLPRSKISVAADGVQVTAIADSPAQKRRFEEDLGRTLPEGVPVEIRISAPRPVIAPFTLRFVIDDQGPRFDACAADSDRALGRILTAARKAGVPGRPACTQGLGAPSPRWAEAAEAAIAAMAELGAGSVTLSDVDVTLIAAPSVAQADFDRVVGELTARLPDVFSLKATLVPRPESEASQGLAQFTATLSPEGAVQLRGRLPDERMRDAAQAFARARFGAGNVYVAARLDDGLPPGWSVRVLSGLAALAELAQGSVLVEPERVVVRGITGNPEATGAISRLLSDGLGQGAEFSVEVRYDERLDPDRGLPGPDECLALAAAVLERRQIVFAPGSVEVAGDAAAVVDDLARALADCGGQPLEIGGHTDSQGRAELNLELSQKRADAVLQALAARGLDVSEMTSRGYGAAEPVADNDTEAGRAANRRIALRLRPPETPALLPGLEPVPTEAPEAPAPAEDVALPLPDEPEGSGEPMGEAGDLELRDDGTLPDADPADAAAVAPPDPGAEPAAPAADPADLVRQALQTPPAAGRGAAPDAAGAGPPPDWQDTTDLPDLRPLRRPEGDR